MLDLTPIQKSILEFLNVHNRCGIWASMGSGKTRAVLEHIKRSPKRTLVIAPLRVVRDVWPHEAKKWTPEVKVLVLQGNPEDRTRLARSFAMVTIINFELLPWFINSNLNFSDYQRIVIDESINLKSFRIKKGGIRSTALSKLAFKNESEWINLSGIPAPNGYLDLWGPMWFLDKGERLGLTYTSYRDRYFYSPDGRYTWKVQHWAEGKILSKIQDICLSINAKEYYNLKEPIITNIEITLPDSVKKLHNEMFKKAVVEINQKKITAMAAAARFEKCLQIADGFIYDEDRNVQYLHRHKIEALQSIINEACGMPILVVYTHIESKNYILKTFPEARTLDDSDTIVDDWNSGKIPMLLFHPMSGGHGLNLQYGGNIIVFFGQTWNFDHYFQSIERIGPMRQHLVGLNRPVYVYNIVAKQTVDEIVIEALKRKTNINEIIMEICKWQP